MTPRKPTTFTPWRLSPDSDPEERWIVTTEDGEEEITGIIEKREDAFLFARALTALEEIRYAGECFSRTGRYPKEIDAHWRSYQEWAASHAEDVLWRLIVLKALKEVEAEKTPALNTQVITVSP